MANRILTYTTGIFIVLFFSTSFTQGTTSLKPNTNELDTSLVIRKSKLLTISEYGVLSDSVECKIALSRKYILAHLENDSEVLKFYSKKGIVKFNTKICFIKIYNSQYQDTSVYYTYRNFCNFQCAYLVAYSEYTTRFYKLYGFVNSELNSFLSDHESGRYLGLTFPIEPKTMFKAINRNLGFTVDVNKYFKYSLNNKYYKFKGSRICDTCCHCRVPGVYRM